MISFCRRSPTQTADTLTLFTSPHVGLSDMSVSFQVRKRARKNQLPFAGFPSLQKFFSSSVTIRPGLCTVCRRSECKDPKPANRYWQDSTALNPMRAGASLPQFIACSSTEWQRRRDCSTPMPEAGRKGVRVRRRKPEKGSE